MSKLVIVESPAKAKTIEKYLPKGYKVRASMGHIRDLPDNAGQLPAKYKGATWGSLGVNVDSEFEAIYVVKDPKSKKGIAELKKELADCDELLLATDEDREGEAISWHLLEELKPKVPVKRMVFNEITKTAVNHALSNTRSVDMDLVSAQETRRIVDRLVGYPLSLLLGKKIKYGLSAGRVQSPAISLLVERERARRRFRRAEYWDLKAQLKKDKSIFEATLAEINGQRIATGKDFDELTGKLPPGKDVLLVGETLARELSKGLKDATFNVDAVTERQYSTSPKPPFTTSTLQQESSRKLGLSAKDTMSIAQGLYENGYITYMRTDSTNLSQQAIDGARNGILELYGPEFLPKDARIYKSSSKGAQEAHEAIRPTGDAFTHPNKTGLRGREKALYELIWKRTVASQMKDAKKTSMRVDLITQVGDRKLTFRANGNRIDFPGFLRAYVEGSDDPEASLEDQEVILPDLKKGENVPCKSADAVFHETKPPARFTEASLVQKLEEEGIGRPSTYATILQKIADGRYARREGKTLIPTYMAFAVVSFLETYFPNMIDLKFTARMEDDLDEIAAGRRNKVTYLHDFYRKDGAFKDQVEDGERNIKPDAVRVVNLEDMEGVIRVGRYGAYAQFGDAEAPISVNIPDAIPPADLTMERLEKLLTEKTQGPQSLGTHPETGEEIYLLKGRFGPYLQLGEKSDDNPKPQTSSIAKNVNPDDITLEKAVEMLSLPRRVGKHPDDGEWVEAGLGRFGPFVRHNKEYRNLSSPSEVFTVTLEQALEVLKQPKGKRASAKVLKELGPHPKSGDVIQVFDGKFGPYIKMGKVNASLPKDLAVDNLTMEKAVELIAEKQAK
jgi:DNA topoisomerase-1